MKLQDVRRHPIVNALLVKRVGQKRIQTADVVELQIEFVRHA